jgi:hypothetical protein
VKPGQLDFCDATVNYCNDIHLLDWSAVDWRAPRSLLWRLEWQSPLRRSPGHKRQKARAVARAHSQIFFTQCKQIAPTATPYPVHMQNYFGSLRIN